MLCVRGRKGYERGWDEKKWNEKEANVESL
jgi:hypothetical protein